MEKKLQRIENDKMIAGVAAGLAEHLNVDPVLVRVGFVLAVLAGFSGILIYVILWIAMPVKPFAYQLDPDYKKLSAQKTTNGSGYIIFGVVLIFMGMYFLLDELDFIPYWFVFHKLWPLAIIIPGIMILVNSVNKKDTQESADIQWDKKQEETDSKTDNNQTI